jgi:hypothetical protein
MLEYEYMRLRLELIPDEIIDKYNLRDLVDNQGWVYIKIRMGMYGLPQAGILTNKILKNASTQRDITSANKLPVSGDMFGDMFFFLGDPLFYAEYRFFFQKNS